MNIWLYAHREYSSISNIRTKILAIFRGIFIIIFAVFQNSCVFIPLFLSEYLTVCCGSVFEKHCYSL